MNKKKEDLESTYRLIKGGYWTHDDANLHWSLKYPNDPQPMFGPQADMRRRPMAKASVCECGSGSNQRGAVHSHWCPLWEVYRDQCA